MSDLSSKPHAVAPPDCPVSDDQYTRNMLDSLAGWLESRSQTVWAKEYGHDDLMQTYGSFLRRFTARRAEPPSARLIRSGTYIEAIIDGTRYLARVEESLYLRAAVTKTARNKACLGDGVPCASDGAGGCVACDDGKGNG